MIAAQKKILDVEDEKTIVRPILYFDIFNYPVTLDEIIQFASDKITFPIKETIDTLISERKIFCCDEFYSLQENQFLAERRKKGNRMANQKMSSARKYSRIISLFPFVRAVMLSGSISKGYMDEKSDIDYFIITEKNRLWIVRTMLAVFRRIFLFNSHKNFCTNYFIDLENLEIKEKNLFTAIEFSTLVPMFDQSVARDFTLANSWEKDFLPNTKTELTEVRSKHSLMKVVAEKMMSAFKPTELNRWLMNKTMLYWKRKYGRDMSAADFEIAFSIYGRSFEKPPKFFQKRVLNLFEQKINLYEMEHSLDLSI